jgi:hypothetical protein
MSNRDPKGGGRNAGVGAEIAVNGNWGTLREDVELFVTEQKANGFNNATTLANAEARRQYIDDPVLIRVGQTDPEGQANQAR